jgi:hypothetical protein
MEAPNKGEPTTSLPAFTPVVFSAAVGTGPGNGDANPANGDVTNILVLGKQLTSVALGSYSVEIDYLGGLQTGWRWCRKCYAVFADTKSGSGAGVCPADNGQHDGSTSLHYAAVVGEDGPGQQGGWRWCRKCASLFAWGPGAVEGTCPADHQQHDGSTSLDYAALYGDDAGGQQGGWRWCKNCASMFAAVGTDQGVCPATASQQAGWRWCQKCLGMFADDPTHGICPADSGPHDGGTSLHYAALIGEERDGQQGGWRWCRKCHGMFYSGGSNQGVCPADNASHDGSSSLHYAVIHGSAAEGQQAGWQWCRKCQGLFASSNPSDGKCPAGGPHDGNGSLTYVAIIGDGIAGHDSSSSQHYAMLLGG